MRWLNLCLAGVLVLVISCKCPVCKDAALRGEVGRPEMMEKQEPGINAVPTPTEALRQHDSETEAEDKCEAQTRIRGKGKKVGELPDRVVIGGKEFVLREDGVWYDREFTGELADIEPVVIEWNSKEFEELMKRYPQVAEYRSVGENVVVIFEGKVYRLK